ncbi:MAG: hypothetical protein FWD61_18305 [Phycisphaerales bacterium]|nr:hypothetical protein [Phycisphaerales bacterium]
MQLAPVACNHCVASLQISDSARFVTCSYCNSQIEIKRTDSAGSMAMADDIHILRRDAELARLDREWAARSGQLFVRNKDGSTSPPTTAAGYLLIFVMGGFGIIWTIIASGVCVLFAGGMHAANVPCFFSAFPCLSLFGVFFIVLAITLGMKTISATGKYQEELRQYQLRRQQLLNESTGKPPPPAG